MAVFHAYLDASGDAEDPKSRVISVAGWISTERKWERFEQEWRKVLKDESVSMLHMRQCAHWRGEFKHWGKDEDRRRRFLERLTKVMKRWTHQSFGVSLLLDAYDDVNRRRRLQETFGRPYALTAGFVVTLVNHWMTKNHPNDLALFIFEKGDTRQGEMVDWMKRENLVHPDALMILDKRIVKGDRVYYCEPLQASDFVAYEHAKAAHNYFYKGETKVRGTMLQISPRQRNKNWQFLDRNRLEKLRAPKR
jgi:hypothetical protein